MYSVMPLVDDYFTNNLLGTLLTILVYALIFLFVYTVVMVVSNWKIFKKAGEPGWASLIPIYNTAILLKISGMSPLLLLLLLVPMLGTISFWIVSIIHKFMLAKSFGKDFAFGLGLLFLNIIFTPILAFSDAKYIGVIDENNIANANETEAENTNESETKEKNILIEETTDTNKHDDII